MTKDEVLMKALEMSLIELLRSVPKNARLIVDNADGMSSRSHPVGYLCHKAAEALEQPTQEPVAWVKDNLICPENGYETTRTEEHPKDLGWTPLYTNPAPSWQGLTAKEIASIPLNEYTVQTVERILKEKNT
jgi:hypothetical protein